YEPGTSEQVTVIIETDACRRSLRRDRHQQLELERFLALARRQQLAGAAEERVAGDVDLERQAERADDRPPPLHPEFAKVERLCLRTQPHVLALTKHLHARRIDRGLVTEAI